jgi:hypothetical protein
MDVKIDRLDGKKKWMVGCRKMDVKIDSWMTGWGKLDEW